MIVPEYHINSVQISGVVVQQYPTDGGKGYLLIETGESQQVWVNCDYEKRWTFAESTYPVGSYVVLEAAIKRSPSADELVCIRFPGERGTAYVSGVIGNISEVKLIEKLDKKVVTFALGQSIKQPGSSEYETVFYNCEMFIQRKRNSNEWADMLLNKLVKGQFAIVQGTNKMEYYTDKNGQQGCKQTTIVNSISTPLMKRGSRPTGVPGNATSTPSAPIGQSAPPMAGVASNGSTATEIDDEF